MSQSVPAGLGGPSSKYPCIFCLGSLHETNKPGVPHRPVLRPGFEETRDAHEAAPLPRGGSASISRLAKELEHATDAAKASGGKQPEAMNFDSCIKPCLIYADGPLFTRFSCTPLHLFLGLGLMLVNELEWRLKQLDAAWAEARGQTNESEKLAKALEEIRVEKASLLKQIEDHEVTINESNARIEVSPHLHPHLSLPNSLPPPHTHGHTHSHPNSHSYLPPHG